MPPPSVLLLVLLGNGLAQQPISRVRVQFERCRLQFGRAQFKLSHLKPAAFSFRKLQHQPGDAAASGGGVDIHATQLHGVSRCGFKTKHADDLLLPQRDPEATASLVIVSSDAIHFLGQ